MEYLYLGLSLGIVSSFHCLGMCGPIALAVPHRNNNKLSLLLDTFLYNTGRAITYAIMGALIGLIGESISFAGYQEIISIISGILLLLIVIMPKKLYNKIVSISAIDKSSLWFRDKFNKILSKQTKSSLFGFGLVNGWLPCGVVYAALAASLAGGGVLESSLFMFLFGLGTIPMMGSIFYFKSMITGGFREKINKVIPVALAIVAVMMIMRGMALGIPYISPVLQDNVKQKSECCH